VANVDDARPLASGYECPVRLPDGTLHEADISIDWARSLRHATRNPGQAAAPADAEKRRERHAMSAVAHRSEREWRMRTKPLVTGLLIGVSFAPACFQDAPPRARVALVTDTYFGTTVSDPYRWMEDVKAKDTVDWIKSQADFARAHLEQLPTRKQILEELNGVSDAGATVSDIRHRGDLFFYAKRNPGEQDDKLYVRAGLDGAERIIIDPEKLSTGSTRQTLYDWSLSWDGMYVSYILEAGGSEDGELRVVETATGEDMGERIARARFGAGEWLPDGKSFLYPRLPELPAGAPETDLYLRCRVFKHVLGSNPDGDRPVFGYGVNPDVALDDAVLPQVRTNPSWKYVFAVTSVSSPNVELYVAPLDALDQPVVPWRKIASFDDQVSSFDVIGNDLFLLTYKRTPRYKIVQTSLTKPDMAHAEDVYSGGEAVVEAMAAQPDALYVQALDGGICKLYRVAYGTTTVEPITLPYDGSASLAGNDGRGEGVYFIMDSWTKPPAYSRYEPGTASVTDTKIIPPMALDMSDIEVTNAKARSHDGTMIPLVVISKKGLTRDGRNPTLMIGYGAYGFEGTTPEFASRYTPWFERGGVLAYAGVRGGGEYGEEWHQGGFKQTKPNTWKDFIACAEYLIKEKITSPAHLAGSSYSAGGILIGRAMTDRPDLFGAAIISVGDTNTLRTETASDGAANSAEYGTVKIEDEFRALYEMDSYHHVKEGVKYPAVLLTHGFNDARVPVWQSAKMAARLQAATASGKPVLLRIDYDAGHGGVGTTQAQRNELRADIYAFLFEQIGRSKRRAGPEW
jgi:prolyl oligopeptidase